jgi:hypothetical protein
MLLNTIQELKDVTGGVMLEWSENTMHPFIEDAENEFIIPAIGQSMFDDLVAEYATQTAGTSLNLLLKKIQKATGRYAIFKASSQMIVSIGDYGIHEHLTQNSTTVSPWRYYEMKAGVVEQADKDLDEALRFMESQAAGTFPSWEAAPEYLLSKELFINNTAALSAHIPIRNSRRAWLVLREFVKEAEIIYALPNLSLALFNDLKTKILTGFLTAEEKQFLIYLRRSLANFAVYKALPKIPIEIKGEGIRISSYQDYYQMKMAAKESALTALKSDSLASGEQWLNIALDYLKDNASATVFSVWYNAQQTAAALAVNSCKQEKDNFKQSCESGVFFM